MYQQYHIKQAGIRAGENIIQMLEEYKLQGKKPGWDMIKDIGAILGDMAVCIISALGAGREAEAALDAAKNLKATYQVGKAAEEVGVCENGGCFVAGTKVKTAEGDKNIEDVAEGDEVWSYDEETGDLALKKVVQTFVRESCAITYVTIAGEQITATSNHPFYVIGQGFLMAGDLKAGDEVLLLDGTIETVETVVSEKLKTPIKVYNFEVEGYHTYYVSEQGVLVHNKCPKNTTDPAGTAVTEGGSGAVPQKARDIAAQVKSRNGAAPQGYRGGKTYRNIPVNEGDQLLPEGVNYKEYDINPYVRGQNRGAERIVIGDDDSVWYTNDHYHTFIKVEEGD